MLFLYHSEFIPRSIDYREKPAQTESRRITEPGGEVYVKVGARTYRGGGGGV